MITIRPISTALAATLLSASAVLALAGCSTTSKKTSGPQLAGSEEAAAKKEYQWKDMSAGYSFYGRPKATPNPGPAN